MIDIPTCFTYAYSDGSVTDFRQTLTSDAASTNLIDFDKAGINIGGAHSTPHLIVRVVGTFATMVSVNIRVQTDSNSNFATTLRDIMQLRIALAQLIDGALVVNQQLPVLQFQRYMRLYFDFFTNNTNGGVVAYLASGPEPHVADFDQVEAAS